MVRVLHVYYPVRSLVLLGGEAFVICASFVLAAVIQFGPDSYLVLNYENGFLKIAAISGFALLCAYFVDLYDARRVGTSGELYFRLLIVLSTLSFVLASAGYLFPRFTLGRNCLSIGLIILTVGLFSWRTFFAWLLSLPRLAEPALLLGSGSIANYLADEIQRRRELGIHLVGYVGDRELVGSRNGFQRLGTFSELDAIVAHHRIGHIVITMSERRGRLPLELLLKLKTHGVIVQDGVELYESVTGKLALESIGLSSLVFSPGFRLSRAMRIYKRALSLTFSALALFLSLPLLLLIGAIIRMDSPGPVIFRQRRVGKDGKVFTLYKFRSMHDGVDAGGNCRPAQKEDVRFTRVGRWLRRTRLDELPQLYNILIGDMYFVGPRPFVPEQEEQCGQEIPYYRQRWSIKPGATGWAQIHRGYCATIEDNAEKLAYDLFYIKNMSFGLDLLIVFKTAKILLLGRGSR